MASPAALCSATLVIEGGGAWSIAFEVATYIGTLIRRRRPLEYCVDPREAATWIARRHPDHAELRPALVEAVEVVRARIGR